MWGEDLYERLSDIYQNQAQYCIILISKDYAEKVWTTHEKRNAQARALREKRSYILPVRFDDTELPGIAPSVGYLNFKQYGAKGICEAFLRKIDIAKSPEKEVALHKKITTKTRAKGKVAIFVDYDNIRVALEHYFHYTVNPKQLGNAIKKVASRYGTVLQASVYGDWSLANSKGSKGGDAKGFQSVGFEVGLIPTTSTKRNRTDMRLALDFKHALLKKPELTVFMLVSGDADFAVVAHEAQLAEKHIIVCGVSLAISRELIAIADIFIALEHLLGIAPSPLT